MKKTVIFMMIVLLVLGLAAAVVSLKPWERRLQMDNPSGQEKASSEKGDNPPEELLYVTSPEGLSLRETPGADGERLGLLSYGEQVTVFHRSGNRETLGGRDGEWVKAHTPEGDGWMFDAWLASEEPKILVDLVGFWLTQDVNGKPAQTWSTTNQAGAVFWRWEEIGGYHFFEFNADGSYSSGIYATGCGETGGWSLSGHTLILNGTFGTDMMEVEDFETVHEEYRLIPENDFRIRFEGEASLLLVRTDTELERLCREGDVKGLTAYVERGNSLDVRLMFDNTPLFFAVLAESAETVRFLLERGADVNARNMYGMTPLHAACEGFRAGDDMFQVVQVLLEYGADPSLTDNEGQTPLDKTLGSSKASIGEIRALLTGESELQDILAE